MTAGPMEDLLAQSDFVFRGTVERPGASAMAEVDDSEDVATVVVDEVVHAPDQYRALAERRVTMLLNSPVRQGEQALFFTAGWLFGDEIAVREIARQNVDAEPGAMADAVAAGAKAVENRRMRRRIEAADVVIAGRVTTVRPSQQTAEAALAEQPSRPITEHDPQWWEAVIDVESVVKGELEAAPTVVLFPGSMDVLWHAVPKFRPGQEGVWFLHRQQVPPVVEAVFPRVFTVLDSHDYQEKDRLEDVRRLIEGS